MVLAGGLGTRMRPATEVLPKALIPVLGRPFADWQLERLAAQGIGRVTYSVGYRGEMLRAHVGDGSRFGLNVAWVDEGERLLGTGGALRRAFDEGALEEAFFVLYGDSYLPVSMKEVEAAWRDSKQPALMTVLRNEGRWDTSNAIYAEGKVVLYDKSRPQERQSEMRCIDYGLSVLTRDVIANRIESGSIADLAGVMKELSLESHLAGLEVKERFYEAGSPQGLRELEAYLSRATGGGDSG
ncbi:MAG: sugar phosphate nucleotidyltransferase [Candidatus Dormiibacterota bacterium]